VETEIDPNAHGEEDDDGGHGAELDAEQLANNAGSDEADYGGGQGRDEEHADQQEYRGDGSVQGQQEVEPEPDVLLPEGNGIRRPRLDLALAIIILGLA